MDPNSAVVMLQTFILIILILSIPSPPRRWNSCRVESRKIQQSVIAKSNNNNAIKYPVTCYRLTDSGYKSFKWLN